MGLKAQTIINKEQILMELILFQNSKVGGGTWSPEQR